MLEGGCHCGALRLQFTTALDPATTAPRACDCSYCRAHGAGWISDPHGALTIAVQRGDVLGEYRQGSETARCLFCRDCGVLIAVVFEHDGRIHGAVNAGCLRGVQFAPSVVTSPQQLSPALKIERWLQLWTADVRIEVGAADTAIVAPADQVHRGSGFRSRAVKP